MTRPILVLALLISLTSTINAQQKTPDAAIEEIRTAFKDINSNKTYKVEKYTYEAAGCADDGRLKYYLARTTKKFAEAVCGN